MLGFNKNKEGLSESKPMKTAIMFKKGSELIFVQKIKIVAEGSGTELMSFEVGRFEYCAIKTTKPLFFQGKMIYFVNANDQNTFDVETLEILSEEYKESFVEYLLKNPERMLKTKDVSPDEMTAHDISQDVLTTLLDERTWYNLLKGAMKAGTGGWLSHVIAGMGIMLILLFIGATLSPDTISITLGGR